jgi:hypothetical protein
VAKSEKTSMKIMSPAGKEPRYTKTHPAEKSIAAQGPGRAARSTAKRKPAK